MRTAIVRRHRCIGGSMATHRVRTLAAVLLLAAVACAPQVVSPPAQSSAPPAAPASPAAAAPAGGQAAPITVEFAYAAVTAPYWHLFIGQDKGFYAEQGVDLSAIFAPTGYPGVVQGLVSGSVGIGSLSADTAIPAIQQGSEMVY